jgi:antitoxin component YwqK of YwqJK toxin-antitoxin module
VTDNRDPTAEVEHYGNGKVKYSGFKLGGDFHGEWKFFRADGSLMRAGAFDRGRQVGVWRTYDRAGKVVKETDMREGREARGR